MPSGIDTNTNVELIYPFRQMVESVNAAVVIVQGDDFVYANPSVKRIIGYSSEELLGMHYCEVVHPDERSEVLKRASARMRGEPVESNYSIRLLHRDGSVRHTSYAASLIEFRGRPAVLGVLQDMTETELERSRREMKLRQAEKMEAIGTLVGGIAHDFNNILAGISGNVHLARIFTGKSHAEQTIQKLQRIDDLSMRAAGMIRQLLAFARKDMVSLKPLDLQDFAPKVMARVRLELPGDVNLTVNVAGDDLWVNADTAQLQQVLIHLNENASIAVSGVEKPCIELSIAPFHADAAFMQAHESCETTDWIRISVSDNGCGMDEQTLSHIFEPFFSTRGVGSGSGLGLSMVYGAVQMHGGLIEVDSRPGEGSRFDVFLPRRIESRNEAAGEVGEEVLRGRGERILYVDDDADLLSVGSDVLRSLGYEVHPARGGAQAVDIFRERAGRIDLVLLDVVMPDMDGRQVAEIMLAMHPEVRLLFMTGYDKVEALNGLDRRIGHDEVLVKPCSAAKLSHAIRRKLDA